MELAQKFRSRLPARNQNLTSARILATRTRTRTSRISPRISGSGPSPQQCPLEPEQLSSEFSSGVVAPARDHQASACHDQQDTDGGRNLFPVLGVDAYMQIARAHAMVFRVWNRNKEGKNPQNQHYQPDTKQCFHKKISRLRSKLRIRLSQS